MALYPEKRNLLTLQFAEDLNIAPWTMGCSQRSFWAGVAARSSTIMLPSSAAAELNTTGPKIDRFISS